jgi:hypothetical protein
VHLPVAWATTLLLLAVIALAPARRRYGDLGWLAATVAIAILANAVACGALSNPNDRYGARMAWLAPFVLALVALRVMGRREDARSAQVQRLTPVS